MTRTQERDRAPTPGEVWDVMYWDSEGTTEGYYISERGKLDLPIAYIGVMPNVCNSEELALSIAADPSVLDGGDLSRLVGLGLCMDLRRCGRPLSSEPVPGLVYGFKCIPLGGPPPFIEPRPFCRYMLEAMADRGGYSLLREIEPGAVRPARGWEMRQPQPERREWRGRQSHGKEKSDTSDGPSGATRASMNREAAGSTAA